MDFLSNLEFWEISSYVVTVVGLPFAIVVFILEQRKERENEEEELFQSLADEYAEFSKILLENADLRLMSGDKPDRELSDEQLERKKIIFDLLISLFERAYLLVYENNMSKKTARLWATWEDYIRFWCRREDFRSALQGLLPGEDPEFTTYIRGVVQQEIAGTSIHLPQAKGAS
jgi:hypothetical protein